MTHLFIEVLSEEIPARMQQKGASDFKRLLEAGLQSAGLSFTASQILVSPRRLALKVEGLPLETQAQTTERKGPRSDAPEKAVQGFLASTGLSLDQCERRTLPKGEFLFAVIEEPGKKTADILPALIEQAVMSIPWPNAMRWGSGTGAWIRPIHSLITLFEGEILPVCLSFGESGDIVTAGSTTVGHRFMNPSTFSVKNFEDYVEKLERSHVMVDPSQRRDIILTKARALASKKGLKLKEDPQLLEEVTGLVEWPVVLMGCIEDAFMALPPEILMTSMKVHQRYFSVENADGTLAPFFIFVANVEAPDQGKTIIEGNERVLGARLSDAHFFWQQDRKKPLHSLLPRLQKITFHEDLGTLYEKVERLEALTGALADSMGYAQDRREAACQAARLCKADLVTEMVYEFPELQGTMGGYYAVAEGLSQDVAAAMSEHYQPRGAGDACPKTELGRLVALAERLDTLVGFFAVGLRPTGSKDPFALRRAILGIIRLQEDGIDLTFDDLVSKSLSLYKPLLASSSKALLEQDILDTLSAFYRERLKVYWKDQGLRPDVVEAVLATGLQESLAVLKKRVVALGAFMARQDQAGEDLLAVYKRATNILRAEGEKELKASAEGARSLVNSDLFQQKEETAFWETLQTLRPQISDSLESHDFEGAFESLATLRPFLDAYFDQVTVNAPEEALRTNRLATLRSFQNFLSQVADFSKIFTTTDIQ